MFWWFERQGSYLRCEILQTPRGFELRMISPDGAEEVEVFADPAALDKRQSDVVAQVTKAGWNGPHGWVL